MKKGVDLHIHSYISDGTLSPGEIIRMAVKAGLRAAALTDHDNIEGNEEAGNEALKYGLNFFRGVEFSCMFKNERLVHILGIGIDCKNKSFLKAYDRMKEARENGVDKILKELRGQGINVNINTLKRRALKKGLDRYDVHKYFMQEGLSCSAQEVWDKYLDPIPYEKGELLSAEEAIEIINKAGGVSILAHFNKRIGFSGLAQYELEKNIEYLAGAGLNGIEKYYPSYSDEAINLAEYLIEKYNLIPSGGTDFHGGNRPGIELGTDDKGFAVPFEVYLQINNKIRERKTL